MAAPLIAPVIPPKIICSGFIIKVEVVGCIGFITMVTLSAAPLRAPVTMPSTKPTGMPATAATVRTGVSALPELFCASSALTACCRLRARLASISNMHIFLADMDNMTAYLGRSSVEINYYPMLQMLVLT